MVMEKAVLAVWLLMVLKVKWSNEAGSTVCCWLASVQSAPECSLGMSAAVIIGVPAVVSL